MFLNPFTREWRRSSVSCRRDAIQEQIAMGEHRYEIPAARDNTLPRDIGRRALVNLDALSSELPNATATMAGRLNLSA
jgi:hypothetical protein